VARGNSLAGKGIYKMCNIMKQFQVYPENTSIHLGYKLEGEPDQHWRKRAKQEKEMRDDLNRIRNAWKMVEKVPAAERKACERQSGYKA
jgi:hypothetical protein